MCVGLASTKVSRRVSLFLLLAYVVSDEAEDWRTPAVADCTTPITVLAPCVPHITLD